MATIRAIVVGLFVSFAASGLCAQEPAEESAGVGVKLSDQQVLDAGLAQHSLAESCQAVFVVRYTPRADAQFGVGAADATPFGGDYRYVRDASRARMDVRLDNVPEIFRNYAFLDQQIINDGSREITHYVRSRQVVISPSSGGLPLTMAPTDLFRPSFAAELLGRALEGVHVAEDGDGNWIVEQRLEDSRLGLQLDPRVDFAIVRWWNDVQTCDITYERDGSGHAYPVRAILRQSRGMFESVEVQARSFTYDVPAAEQFEFQLEPRMLVSDHFTDPDHPRTLEVNERGELVPAAVLTPPNPVSPGRKLAIVGLAAAFTVAVVTLRLRSASRASLP